MRHDRARGRDYLLSLKECWRAANEVKTERIVMRTGAEKRKTPGINQKSDVMQLECARVRVMGVYW